MKLQHWFKYQLRWLNCWMCIICGKDDTANRFNFKSRWAYPSRHEKLKVKPLLFQCCATVHDTGPAFKQHWVNVSFWCDACVYLEQSVPSNIGQSHWEFSLRSPGNRPYDLTKDTFDDNTKKQYTRRDITPGGKDTFIKYYGGKDTFIKYYILPTCQLHHNYLSPIKSSFFRIFIWDDRDEC